MIRFIFRWAFRLLILMIVLVVALILLKDTIARNMFEASFRRRTGLEIKMNNFELGLMRPTVSLDHVVIYNSAQFGGSPFLDIPDLHIEYDVREALQGETHLKLLRLNIREINIVEDRKGRTNLIDVLNQSIPGGFRIPKGKDSGKIEHFKGIDTLNLTVAHVKYTSLRNPRHNEDADVAIRNDIVQNVRTEQDIAAVVLKIFLRAGITVFYDAPRPVNHKPKAN
jgi:hypothetical protein